MEKDDKGSTMIRMGVSGWMFLLVPAYPGCPGSKAVKRSLLFAVCNVFYSCFQWFVTVLWMHLENLEKSKLFKKMGHIWIHAYFISGKLVQSKYAIACFCLFPLFQNLLVIDTHSWNSYISFCYVTYCFVNSCESQVFSYCTESKFFL